MPEEPTIWLTQEAFDKLSAELEQLRTVGRKDVTERIASARSEGDLSENGGYHAAREEQGQMEARIKQLEYMLREAKVGDGLLVYTVAYFGDEDDTETFVLGSREMLAIGAVDAQVYSPTSPLGAAVINAEAGDEVSYVAPNGKTIQVTVLEVAPYTG
ncbi:MAG: transcription elongation factor GreA [Propionibacteriaceae bacterium]|jgi:transcription elongation factor GreA|nr:transcription elongation factor GreA [Propionibacteriaceae bacterium]